MNENQFQQMWNVMRRHNLQLADDTSSEYKCMICKKIVINACTTPCGCRFCLDCIKNYLIDGKRKCPGQTQFCDFEDIDFSTDIHINRLFNKRISQLSVKCPNVGCPSEVQLRTIVDHLRMCENQSENCPYSILGCEGDKLSIDQMRDHLSMEIYPHSKLLINWIRNSQNENNSTLIKIEKVNEVVARLIQDNDKLRAQMRLDKANTQKIFQDFRRKEKENTTEIQTLNDEVCALKNSNRSINEKFKKIKEKTKQQISQLTSQVVSLKITQIEEPKENCELTESKCEEILHQSDVEIKVCDVIKTETTETSKSMANLREIISGEFHWTIDNLAAIVKNAQNGAEIHCFSESYFTHKNGFKFCLSLLSFVPDTMCIYFHIEKGPFDDLLRWPFDLDLKLSLINRETGFVHKTWTRRTADIDADYLQFIDLHRPVVKRNRGIWLLCMSLKKCSIYPELFNNNEISIKLSVKSPKIDIKTK